MELVLYETLDNENVIHKTKIELNRIPFKAKSDLDLTNPVLRLRFEIPDILFEANYAEIVEFDRFYFIRDISNVSNDVWSITLDCDVIESFKNDFLTNEVQLNRKIQSGDFYNATLETETVKEIDMFESAVSLTPEKNIILSTIGVG